MKLGTNLQFTDLAPGARAPAVRSPPPLCSLRAGLMTAPRVPAPDHLPRPQHPEYAATFCARGYERELTMCPAVAGKHVLEMEDGSETLVENPGDVIVMRGALHGWKNPGPGWTRWMTVLIDAEPAVINGVPLPMQAM